MGLTSFNRSRRLAAESALEQAVTEPEQTLEPSLELPESALEQTVIEPEQEPKTSSKKPRKPSTSES